MSESPGRHQAQQGEEQQTDSSQPVEDASSGTPSTVPASAPPEATPHTHQRLPDAPTDVVPLPPPATTPQGAVVPASVGAVPAAQVASPTHAGKVRSPIGGWLLNLITLGVYGLFWYYKVNKELRNFDRSISVKPGLAVICLFVPIIGLVSIYNTGKRIRQAQTIAGSHPSASGVLGVVLTFVFALYLPYYNSQANDAWVAAGAR